MLAPSDEAAVVGGNVTTSRRVVDVILKAFEGCAASQGCMNNLTFADEKMDYYETIAGGAGPGDNKLMSRYSSPSRIRSLIMEQTNRK